MEIGISGQGWLNLESINPVPDYLIKRFGKLLGQLLYNRKELFDRDFSEDFILPKLRNLPQPQYFYTLEEIACKLVDYIKRDETIIIYGDYDADGITSTALLVNFFKDIGVKVKYYIPSRFTEGYGLNKTAIKKISTLGKVLIVCDSGTNAIEELLYAKSLGLEVFVLDHHEPSNIWQNYQPPYLEEKINIINPKFWSENKINPLFRHLATVGIAFYFIAVIKNLLKKELNLKEYTDIVAIGTVADVVPMSFINRTLVKAGLEQLNSKKRAGIRSLFSVAFLNKEINSQDIGYIIGPRINAAGRLEDARKSVKLLITKDELEAKFVANDLENLNKKRQKLTDIALREAEKMIEKESLNNVIVLGKENWHAGIVGIVAGRLTEKYKLPSLILSINNGKAVGSARSVPKVNIYKALDKCRDLFIKFGGHSAAAGLSIKTENIDLLKQFLDKSIEEVAEEKPWSIKEIDMELPLDYWNKEKVNEIKILEPFGEKNPIPKFIARNLRIDYFTNPTRNLILFTFKDKDNKIFTGKSWKGNDLLNKVSVGMVVDIVYIPEINYYKGMESIEFIVDDIKIIQ